MMKLNPSILTSAFLLLIVTIATRSVLGFQTSIIPSTRSSQSPKAVFVTSSPCAFTNNRSNNGKFTSLHAAPIDPGVVVDQAVGGLVNSPAIIAVPIFGGITVALVVVLFIVNSASPTDPDA